jgi:signal transduction histidine kinase/putative methionine-R-sulfoxide reductase with GAF domain
MTSISRASLSSGARSVQSHLAPVIVFIYILVALAIFLVSPFLFASVVRTPFIGAFVEHTLMINTAQPVSSGAWGDQLRLPFGYQIVALAGEKVQTVSQMQEILSRHQVGDQIDLQALDASGKLVTFQIKLSKLPLADQLGYFVIPYLIGLVYLISGLYVFGIRRFDPAGRAFTLFTTATSIALVSLFDLYTTNYLSQVWTFSLAVIGGALINLALLFPESIRQVVRYPFLGWIGYAVAIVLGLFAWPTLNNFTNPTDYVTAWRIEFIFMAVSFISFIAMIVMRRLTASSPVVREQARLIFWGALLSFTLIGVWLVVTTINPSLHFTPLLLIPLAFFPVFTAYAIIRYRLLSTDLFLSRIVLYAMLAALAMASYMLLVGGVSFLVGDALKPTNPLLVGLMIFILAIGLNPARNYLQGAVDRFFFKGQLVYRELQQSFGRELTQAMELTTIIELLRSFVERAMSPAYLHVYVYDPLSGHYVAAAGKDKTPTSDIRFPATSAMVQVLSKQREALFLADVSELPAALLAEQARLRLLYATLFVPLPGRDQLIGWLALGNRRSGEPYTSSELRLLEALCDQAALAVERAQVVADLERHVRELNVLARVAQGVSFTVTFDDILELLSAQANQVLPARDFRVTLQDRETEILSHAFVLENDDRLTEKEGHPIPVGQGLEREVINLQRWLITDDYERECRRRGLLPVLPGVYAWMGVPLNAGAETIGLLSVASRDPAVTYTDEQRDLLQAIADQASGAIVKARSLEETESRARQLAKLNEIGLSLTSTLEIKPLLNQILESAVEILNCQAGSLFLVDAQTDELVFEVVISPVAEDLIGRRLPAGTGLVGQSLQSGKAIIANDVKRRKEWDQQMDDKTGFDTQDMLVIPMRIQDRGIGVIEVINKANGAPFTNSDLELLTAFSNQATIAIENARLYTMTDQALAARVEELSVMQRIDRELNASLDIERAMRITLDWAMRQSRVEAGLVGIAEENGLRVMISQGYAEELAHYTTSNNGDRPLITDDLPVLKRVLETGQPSSTTLDSTASPTPTSILENANLQLAIPIRRETDTIGILLLESRRVETDPDELMNFLMRLSDHAAIAIANARLYEEVKEANLAKSQFVSFVAHELKNPMASIKGYSELVAGGMAGPVNDMQKSFLGTVRSNVDRMNTIVTDLNDLTKIQVGNLRLDYRALPVMEVLDDVVRSLKKQIDEKSQELIFQIPADVPIVWADPARLAQIITNLVSNAHKYTPENGKIIIGADRYQAPADTPAGLEYVHLWVEDSGIGIPEEEQKKIFQQYFRTDTAKEMAAGTGLGLAITKSLVEMQGGNIWFTSGGAGNGAVFHFTIPIAEAQ